MLAAQESEIETPPTPLPTKVAFRQLKRTQSEVDGVPARRAHFTGLFVAAALSVPAATVLVMAGHVPPPFPQGSIEDVAKIVGDLYSGSELTRILDQVGLPDNLGSAMTKWKRLAAAPPCKKNRQASKMAARWSG